MKILKGLLIGIGVVLIVATIILVVYSVIQVNHLWTLADAAAQNPSDPRWLILLSVVGALIGGFALGCGVGLPRRTYKQRKADEVAAATTAG